MKMFLVLLSLFHHHWTTIIFDFQNVVTAFSSEFLFLNVFFNFHIFIDILFRILIACKYHTTFNVLFLIFNDQWICRFSLCRRVSVLFFFKNLAIFTLINQHMQILSSRGLPPNECSANVQKVVEKIYLWVNSFLRTLNSFAKVYESKNSLLGGSQQFISSDFYMKSKILSMKRKSLKLWTHAKKMINLAIRKIKWSR